MPKQLAKEFLKSIGIQVNDLLPRSNDNLNDSLEKLNSGLSGLNSNNLPSKKNNIEKALKEVLQSTLIGESGSKATHLIRGVVKNNKYSGFIQSLKIPAGIMQGTGDDLFLNTLSENGFTLDDIRWSLKKAQDSGDTTLTERIIGLFRKANDRGFTQHISILSNKLASISKMTERAGLIHRSPQSLRSMEAIARQTQEARPSGIEVEGHQEEILRMRAQRAQAQEDESEIFNELANNPLAGETIAHDVISWGRRALGSAINSISYPQLLQLFINRDTMGAVAETLAISNIRRQAEGRTGVPNVLTAVSVAGISAVAKRILQKNDAEEIIDIAKDPTISAQTRASYISSPVMANASRIGQYDPPPPPTPEQARHQTQIRVHRIGGGAPYAPLAFKTDYRTISSLSNNAPQPARQMTRISNKFGLDVANDPRLKAVVEATSRQVLPKHVATIRGIGANIPSTITPDAGTGIAGAGGLGTFGGGASAEAISREIQTSTATPNKNIVAREKALKQLKGKLK